MSGTISLGEEIHVADTATTTYRRPRSITSPRKLWSSIAAYSVLVVVAIFFLAPMVWLVLASFEPAASVSAPSPFVLSFSNFAKILNWSTTFQPLINSAIESGCTAIITVLVSVFAAYPLSRYQLRFRKPFLYTIVFSTGLPITAVMVPVYGMFARFNLIDNIPALIFFFTATSLPFGIWLMKGFMDGVPLDLEQAAWVDGANWLGSLRHVVAPLMMPGIMVITIFTFCNVWGNFFVPFILLETQTKYPASVSIYTFFSQYGLVDYGQLAAFSILYTLPALGLWVAGSRFLRGTFTFAGAVKG